MSLQLYTIRVAHLVIEIQSYPSSWLTRALTPYLVTDAQPTYWITIEPVDSIESTIIENLQTNKNAEYTVSENVDYFRYRLNHVDNPIYEEIVMDKKAHRYHARVVVRLLTDADLHAYILGGLLFLEIASREGFLPLHASALVYHQHVLLFAGPSGIGKTTHTALWEQRFIDEIIRLNDDKPLIYKHDDRLYVTGSPFSGATVQNANLQYPLHAIIFLSQGTDNHIEPLSPQQALPLLIRDTVRPRESMVWSNSLSMMDHIMKTIPLIKLAATPTQDAVDAVLHYFFGEPL